mgnify:FL=1
MDKKNIYIGFDSKEVIASEICEFSIKKNSKESFNINHLKLLDLKNKGLYSRDHDKLSSTEFTFSRFLVPYLQNYRGWAIFCDSDFIFLNDIDELFSLADSKYAVMCVQHEYNPNVQKKKLGSNQLLYPRKNWSSLVLWNCSHPSNKVVNLDLVNSQTGKYLHRFGWLKDQEIGKISLEWNWLVGWYKEPDDGKPKALHYTEGGPWLGEEFKNVEYADIWLNYLKNCKDKNS